MRRDASLPSIVLASFFHLLRPWTRKGAFRRRVGVGENKDFLNILQIPRIFLIYILSH